MNNIVSPKMTYIVLGASGMAGHIVTTFLRESGHEVFGLSSRTRLDESTALVDVFDRSSLVDFLREHPADIVVNCIGALVQDSLTHPDRAAYLNAYLPHLLAAEYAASQTRVFHLSTDCVFSGRDGDYAEESVRDGMSFYDRSKALGELENDKDLTLRTSIIGPEIRTSASGLMNWFLNAEGIVQGYQASMWNGITTLELAKQVERLSFMPGVAGIVHPVPSEVVSKYELLQLIGQVFDVTRVNIEPVEGKKVDKSLKSTRSDYLPPQVDHLGMLTELRAWMGAHDALYRDFSWFRSLAL